MASIQEAINEAKISNRNYLIQPFRLLFSYIICL